MKLDFTKSPNFPIYELLFASINEGALIVNKEGVILLANPRAKELFGYAPDELEGSKIESLIPMGSREKHVGLRNSYHQNPHKRSMGAGMNLQAARKDGSLFYVEVSLNHFTLNNEVYVAALITDISVRVEQENKSES